MSSDRNDARATLMLIITGNGVYAVHFTYGTIEYLRWRCICGTRSGLLSVAVPREAIDAAALVAEPQFEEMFKSHIDAATDEDPESRHRDETWHRTSRRATWATVHRGRCANVRPCEHHDKITARVECGNDDRFEKARGRKLALARALIAAGFTKVERAAIWRSYLDEDHGQAIASREGDAGGAS